MNVLQKTLVVSTLTVSSYFMGCNEPRVESGLSLDQLTEQIAYFQKNTLKPNIEIHKADSIFLKVQKDILGKQYSSVESHINQALSILDGVHTNKAKSLASKLNQITYQRTFVYKGNEMIPVSHILKGQEGIVVEYQPAHGRQQVLRDDRKNNLQTMLETAQAKTTTVYVDKPVYIEKVVEKKVIKYVEKPENKDPIIADLEKDARRFLKSLKNMIDDFESDGVLNKWEKNALNTKYGQNISDLKYYSVHSTELMKYYVQAQSLKMEHFAK